MKTKYKFLIGFFLFCSVLAVVVPLSHGDAFSHLDYVRSIQETGSIPRFHSHINQTPVSKTPFPYPIGYHLFLAGLPHNVNLYQILQVLFATIVLFFTMKISETFGYDNWKVITPLVLSYVFSWISIVPHPDLFGLMLVLISFYFTVKFLDEGKKYQMLIAVLFGAYAIFTRELGALVFLFCWLFLLLKRRNWETFKKLLLIAVPLLILAGSGYYWLNCIHKDVSFFYPVMGVSEKTSEFYFQHHTWYLNLISGNLSEVLMALRCIILSLGLLIPIFVLNILKKVKPQEKILTVTFAALIVVIFAFYPNNVGLDRYVLFALPFLAIAYGNLFKDKKWGYILVIGVLIIYPISGAFQTLEYNDMSKFSDEIGKDDFVLTEMDSELGYKEKCQAAWVSSFWGGELVETFDNVEKLDEYIKKYKVDYILIDETKIVDEIRGQVSAYPKHWVQKVREIGSVVEKTDKLILYEV